MHHVVTVSILQEAVLFGNFQHVIEVLPELGCQLLLLGRQLLRRFVVIHGIAQIVLRLAAEERIIERLYRVGLGAHCPLAKLVLIAAGFHVVRHGYTIKWLRRSRLQLLRQVVQPQGCFGLRQLHLTCRLLPVGLLQRMEVVMHQRGGGCFTPGPGLLKTVRDFLNGCPAAANTFVDRVLRPVRNTIQHRSFGWLGGIAHFVDQVFDGAGDGVSSHAFRPCGPVSCTGGLQFLVLVPHSTVIHSLLLRVPEFRFFAFIKDGFQLFGASFAPVLHRFKVG